MASSPPTVGDKQEIGSQGGGRSEPKRRTGDGKLRADDAMLGGGGLSTLQFAVGSLSDRSACMLVSKQWNSMVVAPASLRYLHVKSDTFTDTMCAGVGRLLGLRELDLGGAASLSDVGVQSLTACTSLRTLSLDSCDRITDAGLLSLSVLTSLQSLNLGGCSNITDTGLQSLSALTSLQSLDLTSCVKLTDTGLQSLSALLLLQSLDISSCMGITATGKQALRAALPPGSPLQIYG
jgi:hypothetical protein